jgi:hypothetical protein
MNILTGYWLDDRGLIPGKRRTFLVAAGWPLVHPVYLVGKDGPSFGDKETGAGT